MIDYKKNKVCFFCRNEYIKRSYKTIYCSKSCYDKKHEKVVYSKPVTFGMIDESIRKKHKLMTDKIRIKSRMSSIKSRALKKGVPFDLTIEVVHYIISHPCVYCGNPGRSEVDRKVPSDGYTIENCVSACRRCNMIKNNTVSYEDMIRLVEFLGWEHRP